MRDLLISFVFAGGLIVALRKPYVGAMLWVWIGLMNPHRLGWGFAYDLPFAMISAVATVLAMAMSPAQVRWPKGSPIVLLVLLTVWMGLTTATAIVPDVSLVRYQAVLKVLVMTWIVASVVITRQQVIGLVLLICGCIGFYGIKGGIFTIGSGGSYRVWGPPSSLIEGNNELAVALIMTIPLLYFLVQQALAVRQIRLVGWLSETWLKRGLYLSMGLCLIAALGSQSRGALLAAIAMGAVLWWRSDKKAMLAIVLVVVGTVTVLAMPESWMERMQTINKYEQDDSAMGRINAWTMAVRIANDRPLGAGFSTDSPMVYQRYAPDPSFVIVAHSIYFQILGEHGYIGLFIYLAFWIATYRLSGRVMRLSSGHPDLLWAYQLGSASKVSIVAFAVGGAFLSLAYWDMPYYLMVLLLATERLLHDSSAGAASADLSPAHWPVGAKPFDSTANSPGNHRV